MKKVAKSSKYLLSYYLQNNFSPCYKLKRLKYLLHLIKNILNLLNKFKTNFINLIYRYLRILYCVYIDMNFYLLFKKKRRYEYVFYVEACKIESVKSKLHWTRSRETLHEPPGHYVQESMLTCSEEENTEK